MKKIMVLLLTILSMTLNAQDIPRHKALNNLFEQTVIQHVNITDPNKAIVYLSSRDNTDSVDYQEVLIDSFDVSDGQVIITRPTSTVNGNIAINPALEACSADKATVEIQPLQIVVRTDRLPVRVRCTANSGEYREVYWTVKRN